MWVGRRFSQTHKTFHHTSTAPHHRHHYPTQSKILTISAPASTAGTNSSGSTAETHIGTAPPVAFFAACTRSASHAMSTCVAPPAAAARETCSTVDASKLLRPEITLRARPSLNGASTFCRSQVCECVSVCEGVGVHVFGRFRSFRCVSKRVCASMCGCGMCVCVLVYVCAPEGKNEADAHIEVCTCVHARACVHAHVTPTVCVIQAWRENVSAEILMRHTHTHRQTDRHTHTHTCIHTLAHRNVTNVTCGAPWSTITRASTPQTHLMGERHPHGRIGRREPEGEGENERCEANHVGEYVFNNLKLIIKQNSV